MKYVMLVLVSVLIIGCEGEDSSPSKDLVYDLEQPCDPGSLLVGIWEDDIGKQIGFNDNCEGYEQNQNVEFTYNKPNQGKIKITVTNDNGGPFVEGVHICDISGFEVTFGTRQVVVSCDGETNTYLNIRDYGW